MDVVRRRVIRCSGPKVLDVEDDLLDVDAAAGRPRGGRRRRRRAAGQPGPGQAAPDARHRRHHPARAGRGDPRAGRRGHPDRGRPGHRQDRGRPAPGGPPALPRPAPVRGRRRAAGRPVAGLHVLCRAGAAVAGRGDGRAALAGRSRGRHHRRPARPARAGRPQGHRCGCVGPAARALRDGAAGRADAAADRLRRRGAAAARERAGRGSGGTCTAASQRPERRPAPRRAGRWSRRCGRPGPRASPGTSSASPRRCTTGPSSSASLRRGGRRCAPAEVLGWLADPARVRRARPGLALAGRGGGAGRVLARAHRRPVGGRRGARRRAAGAARRAAAAADDAGRDPCWASTTPATTSASCPRWPTATSRRRSAPPRPDNYDGYAHVLVDEAQDVSPMQWRMLGRRGQQASWTIVGDAAQSAWPDLGRGPAGPGRGVARQADAPVPPRHELPELGRDLRVRRAGGAPGRSRTRTCPTRSAAPASRRSTAWSPPAESSPRWPRRWPTCSTRSRARSASSRRRPPGRGRRLAGRLVRRRRPGAGRGRHAGQGHGVRRGGRRRAGRDRRRVVGRRPGALRGADRATHRLVTVATSATWRPSC